MIACGCTCVAVHGKDRAISESVLVKSDLENAGFVVNVEKKPIGPFSQY